MTPLTPSPPHLPHIPHPRIATTPAIDFRSGKIDHAFDKETYHQRNKVETVFSVMKRKFGEALKARLFRLQVREIKIKVILYNHSRMISTMSFLVIIEDSAEPIIR